MPTEIEIRVMELLSAIEIPPGAAQKVQEWGTEAVTVVCEAALGTYPGLRPKIRTNAVALLGRMDRPQAAETVTMLINDPNTDVAIRAMRAAGRQKNEQTVDALTQILTRPEAAPMVAAEAAKALLAIDSSKARSAVETYATASASTLPHRGSTVVQGILRARRPQ